MTKIDNILVIVDPTADEQPAVDKAVRLATKFGSRIELFACETKESRAIRYSAHLEKGGNVDFVTHMRAIVDAIARPVREHGIDVTVEIAAGDPLHTELLQRTQRSYADLVIKDTHHHSLAKRTFITNTDWHLIRGCPVPLLLTKSNKWPSAPTVAAAVDPGHVNDKPIVLDRRILEWAQSMRERLGGSLRVVHAYMPTVLMAEAAGGMPIMMTTITPQMMEDERKQAQSRVESLVAPYGVNSNEVAVQLGVASDILPRFAHQVSADLVVMGAVSRSGLQRLFIGSTAERVLEHLPCDILVVKPSDFAAGMPL